jgi:hypothetical protein
MTSLRETRLRAEKVHAKACDRKRQRYFARRGHWRARNCVSNRLHFRRNLCGVLAISLIGPARRFRS